MACAHLNNPLTGGDSWDNSHNDVVRSILTPGSVTREKFITWLDRLADFALNLKDSKGELIPVIFRPLHEHTQGWSWWGSSCTTESEFVEFWQMIVTYLRDTKGVHNLLYAVSPQLDSWYDDQTIRDRLLYRWPGDNFVDFIGMDCYHGENPDAFSNYLRIVAFQVLTIASTTGFCTSDYELWNCPVAILIICAMMFPCGCGGSTAGGMKCSRLIVVGKHLINEIKHCVYPRTIASVRLSGERIDGSFGVIDTYVGGAVGAATNLFVPWVYKRNGFDGTDYSVLNVYRADGSYNSGNVLYSLLDKLLLISLVGAAVDVIPWFFYDLSDTDQKAIVRVLRVRTAAEDKAAGVMEDSVYCEACEALQKMREHLGKERQRKVRKQEIPSAAERRKMNKEIRRNNEEIDIAAFLERELNRYTTPFGKALVELCRRMTEEDGGDLEAAALALPRGACKEERALRSDAIHMARAAKRNKQSHSVQPETQQPIFSAEAYERLLELPEETKEQRREKRALLKTATRERNRCGKRMKPVLWAQRNLLLSETYAQLDAFEADYPQAKRRLEGSAAERTDALSAESR